MDPQELYFFSLRTGRQLPDQLHNHMLLWSFDDKYAHVVKNYVEWVEHCRLRDECQEILRNRIRLIEQADRMLYLVSFLVIAILIAFASGR